MNKLKAGATFLGAVIGGLGLVIAGGMTVVVLFHIIGTALVK